MRCIDRRVAAIALAALVAACAPPAPPAPPAAPAVPPAPAATRPQPPPAAVRKEEALRLLVAQRLVAVLPNGTYLGPAPDPLLAIPVLQIELNADGSVRRIEVLRHPREARDATQIAIDAVRRAAPYGDLTRLPKPWKFTETFLFDDARRFKPRSLEP